MSRLKVYQVVPAPPPTAAWLGELLRVPIAAARFKSPPPLEIRPTGALGGWSAPRTSAPDGRIALSNRVVMWIPRSIIAIYLHESCHALLHGVVEDHHGHDAAFFSLLATLLTLADRATNHAHDLVQTLDLYDIQDLPPQLNDESDRGLGRCITWSIQIANELAEAELSAEAAALEIVKRYQAWLVELSDRPRRAQVQADQAERQARRRADSVERLKDKLFLSTFVAGISSVLLVLVGVMLWQR